MEQATQAEKLKPLAPVFLERIDDLAETVTVCIGKQFRIPEGWVIIGETILPEAPGKWPNGWIIKKPEETEIVCALSPIPEHYVKIEHVGCNACPGSWPNAWKIERLVSATDE